MYNSIVLLLESSETRDPDFYEVPPLLPAKKGSAVQQEDSSETPPPLPAKRGSISSSTTGEFSRGEGDYLTFKEEFQREFS